MKFIFKQSLHIVIVFALCLLLGSFAIAQEVTGTIVGTVRDKSGAVVPGANITITDTQKNTVVRNITASEDGEYSAPNLPSGVYQITIEAKNFKKSVQTGIKLDVGQRRNVDGALEAGNISEIVTVEADPLTVDLQSPTSGTLINGDQVREIPINNRNWIQLATLAPGVSNDLADQVYVGTTNPDGQANTVNISVNGARSAQNTFTVDGADITDRGSNITIQAYPSIDSIGEFRILRSLYPAESGRSGGGQINVVTRSGGKYFHGSGYEFIRNEAFNANSFLNNAVTNPQFGRDSNGKAKRPPFRYNDFGFTIGGPVYFLNFGEHNPSDSFFRKYDRTFFFFSEEKRIDRRFSSASIVTVPDTNLRAGVFPIDVCINRIYLGETCTGANILKAGTPIPTSNRSAAAAGYVAGIYNKLPLPNAATSTSPYNLSVSLPGHADFRQEILKIDHSFSDKLSMYYRFQNDFIPTIDANALFSSGSGLPGVSTTETNSPGRTHTAQVTYAISPNLILEGRYTYAYGAILSKNIGTLALSNTTVPVTLPFVNQKDRVPTIVGNGFTSLTSFGPYDNFSTKSNYNTSLTWIYGSHTTKYGVAFSNYRKNENALAGSNEGSFGTATATFTVTIPSQTLPSNISTALAGNLQAWANFLTGNAPNFTQAQFDYTTDLRQKAIEAYAQDEWRFRPNITLYYGVRYSYFPSPYDKNGFLSNFVPSLYDPAKAPQITGAGNRVVGTGNFFNGLIVNGNNVVATSNGTPIVSPLGNKVIKDPKADFAPRVGIAWDPFSKGKTSIRMGYGVYHDQVLVGTFEQNIGQNQPYQVNATVSSFTSLDNPGGAVGGPGLAVAAISVRSVQYDWHTPYMQHWSLDWQQQLARKTLITIGYYGSKGTHLIGTTELNDLQPGLALKTQCATGANTLQTPGVVTTACQAAGTAFTSSAAELILDQIRPYKGYRSIAMIEPRYDSNYHSLQLSAVQRFSGASQASFFYTWSKNLTNSPNDRSNAPQNTYDIASEYQRATLDRRHIISANYIYELPFFQKQEGFIGKALGGWQASGIITYNTGLPFSVTTSAYDPAGLGTIPALVAGTRPNILCDPNLNAPHTRERWFNIDCFQTNVTTVAAGLVNSPGNTQRGIINGPRTFRVDYTMVKNLKFNLDENHQLGVQLRAEIFNIFNTVNFRSFIANGLVRSNANFGIIGSVRDPRTMQFAAKISF